MGTLITRELVERAVHLVEPTIIHLLGFKDAIWGPDWGYLIVIDQFEELACLTIGEQRIWDAAKWGETPEFEFDEIAYQKAETACRTGRPTSELVQHPERLESGNFPFWPGGYAEEPNSLAVGFSGPKGWTDDFIARIVFAAIVFLLHLELEKMEEEGKKVIE